MKGRKPQPSAVKRLKGKDGRDSGGRIIPDEPTAKLGTPAVPPELSGEALDAWKMFTDEASGMGVMTVADRAAMIMLCVEWARMQEANREVAKTGSVISVNDQPQQNPWLKTYRASQAVVQKLLVEFGLTPSARSRIKLPPAAEPTDELDALLS